MSMHLSKKNRAFEAIPAILAASICAVVPALAVDGTLDGTFTPIVNNAVHSAIPQSDGSILLGGQFTTINDWPTNPTYIRQYAARFSNGGVLDKVYNPTFDNVVYNILAQPDGSAHYCGVFTGVNGGTQRRRIAKLNSAGTVDAGFVSNLTPSSITSMTTNAAGKIIISCDAGLYCLNPDGKTPTIPNTPTPGTGVTDWFYPYAGSAVATATVRLDQKILLGGPFAIVGGNYSGVNTPYLDLIDERGRYPQLGPNPPIPPEKVPYADTVPFSPALGPDVYCMVIQPDGKILVGGRFKTPRVGICRLNENGTLDESFAAPVNGLPVLADGAVRAIALQTNGSILIAGDFVNVRNATGYVERRGIARLIPQGYLDPNFNAGIVGINYSVTSVALQGDGKPLITGLFQQFGTTSRPLVARLTNGAATQTLSTNGTTVTWLRGGTSPEAQAVVLEWKPFGSTTWQLLENGAASRIPGGWTKTLLSPLPYKATIRASARTTAGIFNGSSGIVSATYVFNGPVVGLSRAPTGPIANGGTSDLSVVGTTTPKSFTFSVTNTGDGPLSPVSATITGADASEFSLAAPFSVAPGGSSPLTVTMNPNATPGPRAVTLNLFTNDPNTPFFSVNLTAEVIPAIELFRQEYFGTRENAGDAADNADPDGDGVTNYFEFVAGTVPNDKASVFVQSLDITSGNAKLTFSPRLTGRSYEVQTSTTLESPSWSEATGTTSDNLTIRTFTDAAALEPRRFYRVKITKP